MKNLVYDIGMHKGNDTDFYLKKGFNVIAVEANPVLVEKVLIKFKKEIKSGQLIIINKAIAPKGLKEVEFFVNDKKDDWGTILPDWNRSMGGTYQSVIVETTTLDEIIEKFGLPYYIKIDIEGADILCLETLVRKNVIPKHLSIELLNPNNFKNKDVDALAIFSILYVIGYRRFKVSDQSKNNFLTPPFPSLEGNFVDFSFDGESSGLFGKELDLDEFTIDEVAKMYLHYFYSFNEIKKSSVTSFFSKWSKTLNLKKNENVFHKNGWFDVHVSF